MTFQFGEFFFEGSSTNFWTIIGIFLGPIVSVIITILVFRANSKKEKKREKERFIILGKQIKKYIENLNKYIDEQIRELNKLLESTEEEKIITYEFTEVQQIDFYINKFNEISHYDFFKIYIQDKKDSKLEPLMSLFESISTVERFLTFVKKEFNAFLIKYESCQDVYNESIKELGKFASSLTDKWNHSTIIPSDDKFSESVVKIFNDFISIKGKDFRDIYVSYKEFIEKLRQAYNENLVDDNGINSLLTNCEYSYRDLVEYKKDFKSILSFGINQIQDFRMKIENNYTNLEK